MAATLLIKHIFGWTAPDNGSYSHKKNCLRLQMQNDIQLKIRWIIQVILHSMNLGYQIGCR